MIRVSIEDRLGRRCICASDPDRAPCYRVGYREKMLEHNDIPGILKYTIRQTDTTYIYECPIDNDDTLLSACEHRPLSADFLRNVTEGILRVILKAREYMLVADDFVLQPQTVCVSQDGSIRLLYCPGYGQPYRDSIHGLAEYLLDKVDYADRQAVIFVYGFYMQTRQVGVTVDELLRFVCSQTGTDGQEQGSALNVGEELRPSVPDGSLIPYTMPETVNKDRGRDSDPETGKTALLIAVSAAILPALLYVLYLLGIRIAGQRLRLLITIVSLSLGVISELILFRRKKRGRRDENDCTEPVQPSRKRVYRLKAYSSNLKDIVPDTFPFYIGSSTEANNVSIPNAGIERQHVRIDEGEDSLKITDLGSSEGTYVNSVRIRPAAPVVLNPGDEVLLGGCCLYIFSVV